MTLLINLITISRIIFGAIIFILITRSEMYWAAFVIFCIAAVTDYLDGLLARKFNAVSEIGEVLDPIADKMLIVFLLFAISINLSSYFIGFIASIIIVREIWVGALRDLNARQNRTKATKVTFLAKIKTTIQLFCISIYLLGIALNNMLILLLADMLIIIALLITVYTGFNYTYKSLKK